MKFCANCGAQLPDDARFCAACGTPVSDAPAAPFQPDPPVYAAPESPAPDYAAEADGTVRLCPDGMYRWVYELNLFKNFTVLGTIIKIFGFILLGLWLLTTIADGFDGIGQNALVFLGIFAGVVVVSLLGYLLYAAVAGGKYCVLFEMNETGLRHIQLPRQYKKAQVMGALTVLLGSVSGRPGMSGTGLLASERTSSTSTLVKVKRLVPKRRYNLIKVNQLLNKNRIFVRVHILSEAVSASSSASIASMPSAPKRHPRIASLHRKCIRMAQKDALGVRFYVNK